MADRASDAPACLVRHKTGELDAAALADPSARPSQVEAIELRGQQLEQLPANLLDRVYSGCRDELHTLHLENCTLSDRSFALATDRLAQNNVKLRHLTLRSCQHVSMTSLIAMPKLFSSSLVSLELSSCKLARQAGIILSQSIPSCRSLRRLNLANNHLRDGGVRAIMDALKAIMGPGTSALDELNIAQNGLSPAGFASLFQVAIRHVNAADNVISCVGTALTLAHKSSLESLDLSGNLLAEDGVREIATSLGNLSSSLRVLKLRNCGLTLENVNLLVDVLQQAKCSALQELHVGDNREPSSPQYELDTDAGRQEEAADLVQLKLQIESVHPRLQLVLPFAADPASKTTYKLMAARPSPRPVKESPSPMEQPHEAKAEAVVRPPVAAAAASGMLDEVLPSSETNASVRANLPSHLLQHVDVEYIVSKTIECMNQNFEQRLGQFLLRMESQHHDKSASQVQFLTAKVDACERALPRLESRLDALSDRIATGNAQLLKLQNEFQLQLQTLRQDVMLKATTAAATAAAAALPSPTASSSMLHTIAPSTRLSRAMHAQVDELVTTRIRSSEQLVHNELRALRREPPNDPKAVVDAVSMHLAQFKQEFDANQSHVLHKFTENIVKDSLRLEDRMSHMDAQIVQLEGVIQAEQQSSLLALEAISEAFASNSSSASGPPSSVRRR